MKDLVKHKKYKEDEKLRKWAAKKTKQANAQMTTPQPIGENYSALQTTQLQIVVRHFLANKHSIIV